MHGLLTIGDFSRITQLSIKTLRRYHESGMLEPVEVDPHTGYRYYTTSQVPTAQVIRRFRSMDMPEREVREIVTTPDPGDRTDLIVRHLDRLEQQMKTTETAVRSLRRLLDPSAAELEVERRLLESRSVAAISDTVDGNDVLEWYSDAMAELDDAVDADGPSGGLYDNELFTEGRGQLTVFLPTPAPPTVGRIHPVTLGPVELAVTVHHGPHGDIDVTYGALGTYVEQNGLAIAGPVHETYVVGPHDTEQSSAWRTEIGWPVFGV